MVTRCLKGMCKKRDRSTTPVEETSPFANNGKCRVSGSVFKLLPKSKRQKIQEDSHNEEQINTEEIDQKMENIDFDKLSERMLKVSQKPECATIEDQMKKYDPDYVEQNDKYYIQIQLEKIYEYVHDRLENIKNIYQDELLHDDLYDSLKYNFIKIVPLVEHILKNCSRPQDYTLFSQLGLNKLKSHIKLFIEFCNSTENEKFFNLSKNIKYAFTDFRIRFNEAKRQIKEKHQGFKKKYKNSATIQLKSKLVKQDQLYLFLVKLKKMILNNYMLLKNFKVEFLPVIGEEHTKILYDFFAGCDKNDLVDHYTVNNPQISAQIESHIINKALSNICIEIQEIQENIIKENYNLDDVKEDIHKVVTKSAVPLINLFSSKQANYIKIMNMLEQSDEKNNTNTVTLFKYLILNMRNLRFYPHMFSCSSPLGCVELKKFKGELLTTTSFEKAQKALSDAKNIMEIITKTMKQYTMLNSDNPDIISLLNQMAQYSAFKNAINLIKS